MFRRLYNNHKKLLYLLVTISILFIILNIFIERNRFFFAGEYLFSFDYSGHIQNVIKEYFLNPQKNLELARCDGCPDFYQNSPWVKFWYLVLLGSGSYIGLHPFITYFLLTITTQLIFLYLFVKLIFKQIHFVPFVVAAFIFILFPQKIYLSPAASQDGVIQGFMVGTIALLIYILKNISNISWRKIFLLSLLFGIILSVQLNIASGYLPVTACGLFFILLIYGLKYIINLINNRKFNSQKILPPIFKTVLSLSFAVFISILLNLPFIISNFISGNTHSLTNFNPLDIKNSLTILSPIVGVKNTHIFLLFITFGFLWLISDLKLKFKAYLALIYLLTAFLMTGGKIGEIYLYDPIFSYIPLMDHMRSLYRFSFYELLIVFIVVYFGLSKIFSFKNRYKNVLAVIIILWFSIILVKYIYTQKNMFQTGIVPKEYFLTDNYLSNINEKKIYFPFYMPPENETLSENFSWFTTKAREPGLRTGHINPFTSLFAVPNILASDGYPLETVNEAQLRSLIIYNKPQEIIEILQLFGVKYLILDKNYFWNKNFPKFKVNEISQYAKLDKKFGNIEIYRLKDKHKDCKPAYGDFKLGYCYNPTNPQYLINKTPQDYVLDNFVISNSHYIIPRNNKVRLADFIVDPSVRISILEQDILIPFTVYQADRNIKDIFNVKLKKNNYTLFIPVLHLSHDEGRFKDSRMLIKIDGKTKKTITPYSAYQGMLWERVDLTVPSDASLSIDTEGSGFMIFGKPLLFTSEDMKMLNKKVKTYSNLNKINIYKSSDVNLEVKINNQSLEENDIYADTMDVDLLNGKFANTLSTEEFKKNNDYSDGFPVFSTQQETNSIETRITSNKRLSLLEFTTGTAFLDDENLGKLIISDENNQIIYQTSIFKKDTPFVKIVIPDDVIYNLPQTVKVQLLIDKKGVLLSRYTVRARF